MNDYDSLITTLPCASRMFSKEQAQPYWAAVEHDSVDRNRGAADHYKYPLVIKHVRLYPPEAINTKKFFIHNQRCIQNPFKHLR